MRFSVQSFKETALRSIAMSGESLHQFTSVSIVRQTPGVVFTTGAKASCEKDTAKSSSYVFLSDLLQY